MSTISAEIRPVMNATLGGRDQARAFGRGVFRRLVRSIFTKHESQAAIQSARRRVAVLAVLLDGAFLIPGTSVRIGLDPLVGLIPVAGDVMSAAASLYIVYEGWRLGATRTQIAAMLGNVAIDALAGSVPGIGDVIDVAFKANMRNLAILGINSGVGARSHASKGGRGQGSPSRAARQADDHDAD
jgi:hypothetical protein